jgi:hypothetical protein
MIPPVSNEVITPQVEQSRLLNNESSSVTDAQPEPLQVEQVMTESMQLQSTTNTAPSLQIESVPHLSDMPDLVQQAIPDMSFSGHVYSSDIRQRSVIINGHSMGEGEMLIKGLVVEQITSNGIIFSYQGQLFRMDILQDWSFD